MAVHKDCYSAIDLTQQDGLHRRETRIVADLSLDKAMLQDVLSKKL